MMLIFSGIAAIVNPLMVTAMAGSTGRLIDSLGGGQAIQLAIPFITLLYYGFQDSSRHQGTVGRRVVGIIVTDLNGYRISFIKATLRKLVKLISYSVMLVGFLIQPLHARKQTFHDVLAGTLVLKKPRD